jgi:hypothetical protein
MKKQIKETAIEILEEFTRCYSEADEEHLEAMLKRLCDKVADSFAVMLKNKLDGVISEVKLLSTTETEEPAITIRKAVQGAQIGVLETVRDVTVSEVKYRFKWDCKEA